MKMTEIVNEVVEQEQPEVNEVDNLRQQLADAQKAIEALANKKDELLKETKAAKEERRRQAELADQAKQEQLATAQKNGEFEKLWKQEQEEKAALKEQLNTDRKERRNEKVGLSAMRLAVDMAKGDASKAELLSTFLANSISNLADDFGNVDEDTLISVRKQFEADKKYSPLLGGNLSNGGSATGNTRSANQTTQTATRDDFNAMSHEARRQFFSKGGKLTD